MGVPISVLDPAEPAAAAVAAHQVVGSFDDATAIEAFVLQEHIDILTVEIEHVNVDAIETVQQQCGLQVHPSPLTLRIIQDKFRQKQHFEENGIAVAAFREIANEVWFLCLRYMQARASRDHLAALSVASNVPGRMDLIPSRRLSFWRPR